MSIKSLLTISLILAIEPIQAQGWHTDITHRPRLIYTVSEITDIKSRLGTYPYNILWNNSYGRYTSVYTNAGQLVENPTPNTIESPRKETEIRSRIAKDAAFVYAMNKRADGVTDLNDYTDADNPHPRDWYKNHAVEYLEDLDPTVIGPNWPWHLEEGYSYMNNWLFRSEELIYYCEAYDMLLGAGMPVNSAIESKISQFAENLHYKITAFPMITAWLYTRNNRKLIVSAALGMAAVTLNNDSNAEKWINFSMSTINWILFSEPRSGLDGGRQIDDDGGYIEGPNYMRYAWRKLIPLFKALKNFNGDWWETYNMEYGWFNGVSYNLRSPWYDSRYVEIHDWVTKIRLPEGRLPAIEDSPLYSYFPELSILGGHYSWPYESYTVNKSKEQILNSQLGSMRVDYIAAGNAQEQNVPGHWQNNYVMTDGGNVVFRSDWSSDAIYLHINAKNGITRATVWNHDQADATSFILGYKGRVLALDAGYPGYTCRYEVNKPENHNLILVDGYGPKPPCGQALDLSDFDWTQPDINDIFLCSSPSPTDAYINNSFSDGDFSYVGILSNYGQSYYRDETLETEPGQEVWLFDESDNTSVDFQRNVAFVGNSYFVISDVVDNHNTDTKQYTWLLHGNSGGDTDGEYTPLIGGGIFDNDGAKLRVYTTSNDDIPVITAELSSHTSQYCSPDDNTEDYLDDHIVLKAAKQAVDAQFLSVLYPFDVTNEPEVVDRSSNNYSYLFVDRSNIEFGNRYDVIVSNMTGGIVSIPEFDFGMVTIPPFDTDRELVVISFDASDPTNQSLIKSFEKKGPVITINGTSLLNTTEITTNTSIGGNVNVNNVVTVSNNATLTIEQGSMINFSTNGNFTVLNDGKLEILGTEAEPITLTGAGRDGGWTYYYEYNGSEYDDILEGDRSLIQVNCGESIDPFEPNLEVENVIFRDAKNPIVLMDDYPTGNSDHIRGIIRNSTIENVNVGMSLNFKGEVLLENVTLNNNNIGIYIPAITGNMFGNNKSNFTGKNLVFSNNNSGIVSPYDIVGYNFQLDRSTFSGNRDFDIFAEVWTCFS